MAAEVLRCFDHSSNLPHAAEQDYELALAGYEEACLWLDCTREEDVERFRAAVDRLGLARDRWAILLSEG